ncbi:hypothetical protein MSIBF_A2020037 [groundwater metagenome]|uniref:Uncharacterized protein n=1 Tax=groundwater metagenome TaxID=717931 RepID=A0A098EB21_9ZZZZ
MKFHSNITILNICSQIRNNAFIILNLESLGFNYNIKTFRIGHEFIEKGFKPGEIKFMDKKKEDEKNLLRITLISK